MAGCHCGPPHRERTYNGTEVEVTWQNNLCKKRQVRRYRKYHCRIVRVKLGINVLGCCVLRMRSALKCVFFTYSPLGASSQISNQTSRSNLECMWLQLQREDISDLIISYCTNRRKFISKCKCMYTSQFFFEKLVKKNKSEKSMQ